MDIVITIPREKIPEWMIQNADDMVYYRGISKLEALTELLLEAIETARGC